MDDVNVAVRRLVAAVLGLGENDVRPANQTAPAGKQSSPFATVLIMDDDSVGTVDRAVETDGAGGWLEAVYQPERFTASIQFFGASPKAATLRGAPASSVPADYTGVTVGGFDVSMDGAIRKVSGINAAGATTMAGVAAIVQARLSAALAGATCVWTGKRFLMTSPTTGQTSSVRQAVATTTVGAADVSTLLALTAAAGAVGSDNATGIASYGADAFDRARRLPVLLDLSANVDLMQTLGLGFEDAGKARNLAALADSAWESRGSIDVTFNIVSREALAVAAVASVPIGLNVLEPDGTIQTRAINEVSP